MGNDGLVFTSKEEQIIFNFHSFCEVLKGCIQKYCNISFQEAHDYVENCKLFKSPIATVNDVYFFSHEHPFHWAMICRYGDSYWDENPELVEIPNCTMIGRVNVLRRTNLKEELFIFI